MTGNLPSAPSLLLAAGSSVLLIFAFPDFGFWILGWVALVPMLWAIEREKDSFIRSFILGWISGTLFFFGTCWWLTFAPVNYGGVPTLAAYFLLFGVTAFVGLYIALFAGILSLWIRRCGIIGFAAAPFLWTAIEFIRLWTTGNNWNALGYSQAFNAFVNIGAYGGVPLVSFWLVVGSTALFWYLRSIQTAVSGQISGTRTFRIASAIIAAIGKGKKLTPTREMVLTMLVFLLPALITFSMLYLLIFVFGELKAGKPFSPLLSDSYVVAVQPNVPMDGLTQTKWRGLRERQTRAAELAIEKPRFSGLAKRQAEIDDMPVNVETRTRYYEELALESFRQGRKIVILPESPMNFQYQQDPEFRAYITEFADRNNVSVLFNSAEPDKRRKGGYFNSAVLINERGAKTIQYDKIYLLPFGEYVPLPDFLGQFVPTMVGRFSAGEEYDLLPVGGAKAGVMICFESHFASLSRQYALNGADLLIEMTNDGYLGDTPVLKQHLASAVFRAVETNRPVLRVTNVGITGYINQRGEILDSAEVYTEATRVWAVSKSDKKQTLYVLAGDWFAWLCLVVSLALSFFCLRKPENPRVN